MAWVDDGEDFESLNSFWAGGALGKLGARVMLPVKYCETAHTAAKNIVDLIQPHTAYALTTISCVVTRDTEKEVPQYGGAEPNSDSLLFSVQTEEGGEFHKEKITIPGFVPAGATAEARTQATQTLGEAIAQEMMDQGAYLVKFTGTTGGRRR